MNGPFSRFLCFVCLAVVSVASCEKAQEPASPEPAQPSAPSLPLPTSVSLTEEGPLNLAWGESLTLGFTLSPLSALDGLSMDQIADYVKLEGARGQELSGYTLSDLTREGDAFRALLSDNRTRGAYSDEVVLVYARTDASGKRHQVRSRPFTVVSTSFPGLDTGLPVVYIDTPEAQPITSKEVWMEDVTVKIFLADGTLDYDGTSQMKGRGNSTWTQFPKKPYALKLDKKAQILGMPKHKRWCLLANWMDRTLIRNAVAFEIARRTDLAWTPSGFFVELILNGTHLGNYYLCEQVKVDENRVNITELKTDSIEGGYLMEIDAWFDEAFRFRSSQDVPWQFKDPDEVTEAQFNYMSAYVEEFENALYDDALFAAREYTKYVDTPSWADWWLVNELAQNGDVNQPKSIYLSKDVGGKLVAGPVWDFDWGTFIPAEYNTSGSYKYDCTGPKFYINRIRRDSEFRRVAKQRWTRYRDQFATIPDYIDQLAATLEASDAINSRMWPISRTTNQDVNLSFKDAVARLKKAYLGKLEWLDNEMKTNY